MEYKLQLIKKIAPDLTEEMVKRYRVLKTVRLLQPCGRRLVVLSLGMTERTVRSEIERLSAQNLVHVSKIGMSLTEEGMEVLEGLEGIFSALTGLSVLEEKLAETLGAQKVFIAQGDSTDSERAQKEMGQLAARVLFDNTTNDLRIAIAGGSAMAELVQAVPEGLDNKAKMVLPARGSIGRRLELQADTLAAKLAEKLQADYRLLHLPDNLSPHVLEEMKKDPDIAETIGEMEQANILLLGVGNALEMAEKRHLDENIRKQLEKDNAVAEACGYYFNGKGKVVYETRSIGIDFNDIDKMDCIIVVAGGKQKAESLLAVSHSIPNGIFVTDEGAALEMLRLAGK
ncbi:sugar-binding transcriptional regulator [Anaerotignum sp.]|nr:sugar-binding domain-containing protein [Anaerotignum sp.]MBQ7758366.1 sugar-binding transcriptional regulator [Anaerotignum sp.]